MTSTLVLLFGLVASAVAVLPPPHISSSQYRDQDVVGQYNYGFMSTDGISRSEARKVDGSVVGSYSYVSPEGKLIEVTYTAGPDGFQAMGNAVPNPSSKSAPRVPAPGSLPDPVAAQAFAQASRSAPVPQPHSPPPEPLTLTEAKKFPLLFASRFLPYSKFSYNFNS